MGGHCQSPPWSATAAHAYLVVVVYVWGATSFMLNQIEGRACLWPIAVVHVCLVDVTLRRWAMGWMTRIRSRVVQSWRTSACSNSSLPSATPCWHSGLRLLVVRCAFAMDLDVPPQKDVPPPAVFSLWRRCDYLTSVRVHCAWLPPCSGAYDSVGIGALEKLH